MFRARLLQPEFSPGAESQEVGLYPEEEIPWEDIAFPSSEFALRCFLEDRARGREDHHVTELNLRPARYRQPVTLGRAGTIADPAFPCCAHCKSNG